MAMWRDPLDELIADLERAVPAALDPPGHDDVASMQNDLLLPLRARAGPVSRTSDRRTGFGAWRPTRASSAHWRTCASGSLVIIGRQRPRDAETVAPKPEHEPRTEPEHEPSFTAFG